MKTTIISAAFVMSLLAAFMPIVFAIPGVPHQFWGTVTINGAPAPDGTSVTATIDGKLFGSTTTYGGSYNLIVENTEGDLNTGKTVLLYANGIQAGSGIFVSGKSTRIDLAITVSSQSSSGTSSGASSIGGGGGGGGGSSAVTPEVQNTSGGSMTIIATTCEERWICDAWSECVNGVQTRTCTDTNNCGTDNDEPMTSQPCANEKATTASGHSTASAGPLGFFFGVENTTWAGIIIGIAIIGLLIYAFRKGKIKIPSWHKGFSSKAV